MASGKIEFIDIIEPRRRTKDTLSFMTRYWNPQPAYRTERILSPQQLKDDVATSLFIERELTKESERTGRTREELLKEVLSYLDEIGLDRKMYVIRWLGVFTIKSLLRSQTGVLINERRIFQLKGTMGDNPVIILPTHRSYADFILMTYVCYHYDLEFTAVAAGLDFYNMAIMGRVMRDSCAFYMRRTFIGNPLYAATFKRYIRTLITKHHAPLEFFLEGTRSRSNKSMMPKYGLLSMVLAPLFSREVSDLTIVPVNITYDRLLEHRLFTYEHIGVPKPQESTGGLLRALNVLNEKLGNIYINVGAPLSVRSFFGETMISSREDLKPVEFKDVTPDEFQLVQALAEEVIHRQQEQTTVTAYNLVCMAVMMSLVKNSPLTTNEFYEEITWLTKLFKEVGANILYDNFDSNKDDVKRILKIHENSLYFDRSEKLKLVNSAPMLLTAEIKKKMKGHILKEETMHKTISPIALQLYINPVLYNIIPHAIICSIVSWKSLEKKHLLNLFQKIRALLKYEFVYHSNYDCQKFEASLLYCVKENALSIENDIINVSNNMKLREFLTLSIWPFFKILQVSMMTVSQIISVEEKKLMKKIQEHVEILLLSSNDIHPYCLSLESIKNCILSLSACGCLLKERKDAEVTYSVDRAKTNELLVLLSNVTPNLQVKFDSTNKVLVDQQNNILSRL